MRIAELSRRSEFPVSAIKFYIREGLLPPGERTARNQALYSDEHLRRLELIRALRDVCGLGTETTKQVLEAMDDPARERDPIRIAIQATKTAASRRAGGASRDDAAIAEAQAFLDGLEWTIPGDHGEFAEGLASALVEMRRLMGADISAAHLAPYARAAWALSEAEWQLAPPGTPTHPKPGDPLSHPVRVAILGILLGEPILLTLRRYALHARGTRHFEGLPLPRTERIDD